MDDWKEIVGKCDASNRRGGWYVPKELAVFFVVISYHYGRNTVLDFKHIFVVS